MKLLANENFPRIVIEVVRTGHFAVVEETRVRQRPLPEALQNPGAESGEK
jgi:hypothetical protein